MDLDNIKVIIDPEEDIKTSLNTGSLQYGQLEIGTTTTGKTGEEAAVTNSGSSTHAVLNFTIPRGEKGEQGIQGIQGLQGENGIDGKDGNGISNITRYYLASAIGVSGGGSKIIEWDGDTTDKELMDVYYKVSDEVFTIEELIGQTVELTSGDEIVEMKIGRCGGTNDTCISAFPEEGSPELLRVVRQTTDDLPFSVGTYFLSYMGMAYASKLTVAGGGISKDTDGWTTEVQTIDSTNKYLWSYEVIEFTNGTNNTSEPVIIGVYGDKGADGQTPDMSVYYTKEETNTAIANAIGTVLEGSY